MRRSPGTMRQLGLAFACAALLAAGAEAATLYRLVDRQGKVTYSDKIPKGFDGEVTRIERDPDTNAVGGTASKPAVAAPAPAPAGDVNSQRKARRLELEAALDRAREKLAAAKRALDEGGEPREEEYQTIQQRFDAADKRPPPRPTCMRRTGTDGRDVWICPTRVPGVDYFDRQKALEEAVRLAEAEVEAAELAYRRGVD